MKYKGSQTLPRIVVGVSGASGAIYAVRLLKALKNLPVEVHFVASQAGYEVLAYECQMGQKELTELTDVIYDVKRIDSAIASGSFLTEGMVILPCSMKTLGCLASGINDNLLTRAADVHLKEGRKLILVPREAPIHAIHLENMLKLSQTGARIIPAAPGFYHKPTTIEELVDQLVGKICDNLGLNTDLFKRWQGTTE